MLGLDGVSYSMLRPAFAAGHMLHLRSLLKRGASGILLSTVPPYTPPAWTSIFTGVNPGRHGILGFTLGNVQRKDGLARLDRVKAPAIWSAANAQGARMGLLNVPMTYPPPKIDGFAVSGMLTPGAGGETPDNFTQPDYLGQEIRVIEPSYEIDIQVNYEEDWKTTDIIERLSRNLATKRKAWKSILERHGDVSILFAVLEAPDRLMHVHYKYIDPACEQFGRPEASLIRDRAWAFFDEIDAVLGDLLAWAGDDAFVLTMSDHGFGPLHKLFNVNLALHEWGLLEVRGAGKLVQGQTARKVGRAVKRVMPRSLYRRAKGAAHSHIDWSRTAAFCAPIPQQGIYINLEDREPYGSVPASRYEALREEITDRLLSLRDPDDGKPVVDHVYRREEVLEGPEADAGPDLYPVCRAYSYELSDGLFSPSVLTDWRHLPRGFHHMEGIFGVSGPGIRRVEALRASLYDIAPTVLYLAGLGLPEMDGRIIQEALPDEMLDERPAQKTELTLPRAGEGVEAKPYSAAEEAQIEESLRNLGYL